MTLKEKLKDLLWQATTQRSHYYTGHAIKEAIAEIERLEKTIEELGKRNAELTEKAWMYDDLCR